MGPAQLVRQCRNNLFMRECLCELHHACQICALEAAAELRCQLVRQRRDNLFPIAGSLRAEHLSPDAIRPASNKEESERRSRRPRPGSGFGDQPSQVRDQVLDQVLGRMRGSDKLTHGSSSDLSGDLGNDLLH